MGVSKTNGTPKSSILIGFSTINHPFWGTPIFGKTQIHQCPGVHKTSGSLCKLQHLCHCIAISSSSTALLEPNGQKHGPTSSTWYWRQQEGGRSPVWKIPEMWSIRPNSAPLGESCSAHTWNRKLHCKTRPGSNICKSILPFECMYECQGMATGNCCERKRSPPVLVQILKITSTDLHSSAFQPGSPLRCGPCSYQEVHHLESSKHKQFCPPAA